jgi:hypothetical protein
MWIIGQNTMQRNITKCKKRIPYNVYSHRNAMTSKISQCRFSSRISSIENNQWTRGVCDGVASLAVTTTDRPRGLEQQDERVT